MPSTGTRRRTDTRNLSATVRERTYSRACTRVPSRSSSVPRRAMAEALPTRPLGGPDPLDPPPASSKVSEPAILPTRSTSPP